MLFERFTDDDLSHYSYALGCPGSGELAIVDPRRDVDVYLRFADEKGLEITRVLETHIHADFASGARELARRSGAELLVSGHDEGEDFEVGFEHTDLCHGDEISFGSVRIRTLHTPGHTPEHISFLVFDEARSTDKPMLLLSGDFLFVGSLGRPDLLGEDAKRALAERLYDSVQNVLAELPDGVEVHPAHGAGSMCGSGMSGRPQSTLGFERAANPYLAGNLDRDAFVEKILTDVPPFPDYYRRMKRVNSEGPTLLCEQAKDGDSAAPPNHLDLPPHTLLPGLTPIDACRFAEMIEKDDPVIVDLRHRVSFGGGHIPQSIGIGIDGKVSTWSSWMVPYERPLLLITPDETDVESAVRSLVRVGLDEVVGYLDGGIMSWPPTGGELETLPQWTPAQVHAALNAEQGAEIHLLDVRSDDEWSKGHAPGAIHVMAGKLADELDKVPNDDLPVAVVCGSGYRSTAAASVLMRNGYKDVINVLGGMSAWNKAGLPTESGS